MAFALAEKIGKHAAHALVGEASRKAHAEKRGLRDVLAENDQVKTLLNVGELGKLFEPTSYQGVAQTFIDRLIASIPGRRKL